MKKQVLKLMLLALIVVVTSCSSSNDPLPNVNTITFTVNGLARTVNANNITIQTMSDGGVNGGPVVVISGAVDNAFNETISISIKEGVTGNNSLNAIGYANVSEGVDITYVPTVTVGITCGASATSNTINFVTDINDGTQVSGSFTLSIQTCVNGSIVTDTLNNGVFNVSF